MNYPDTKPLPTPTEDTFDVVFMGEGPHLEFVEVEKTFGHQGMKIGEWWTDEQGYQRLTVVPGHPVARLLRALEDKYTHFSLHWDRQSDPYAMSWSVELPGEDALYGGTNPIEALEFALEPGTKNSPPADWSAAFMRLSDEQLIEEVEARGIARSTRGGNLHSVVITERGPNESWLFNLDVFNSQDDVEISPEVGKAILALSARQFEEE
jgi:hypothetical protein